MINLDGKFPSSYEEIIRYSVDYKSDEDEIYEILGKIVFLLVQKEVITSQEVIDTFNVNHIFKVGS